MVLLLRSGVLERLAVRRIARGQRLPLVQGLRADLSDVVDPHQRRRMGPLRVVQRRLEPVLGRRRALRAVHPRDRPQRNVESFDQAVQAAAIIGHLRHLTEPARQKKSRPEGRLETFLRASWFC